MDYINTDYITKIKKSIADQEIVKHTAFHLAGYAAAIYLCNRLNSLPPVYFQVANQTAYDAINLSDYFPHSDNASPLVKVKGGRLIDPLSVSIDEYKNYFSESDKNSFKKAFEADIINLIAGPLAEAKYVSIRDNEIMNSYLVNFNALKFYGGSKCIELTQQYVDCFISDEKLREDKISELFSKSFDFINDYSNWKAIAALAHHILTCRKKVIECEEAIDVLESNFAGSFIR